MRSQSFFRWEAALVLAVSLVPSPTVAQNGDTISITGTFKLNVVLPTVGADLAGIQPNAADRWWKLTLHGVTYSHEHFEWFEEDSGEYVEDHITRAHATSFTMEFFGADAAVLNSAVGGQLARGGLPGGAVLELANHVYAVNPEWGYGTLEIKLWPAGAPGVSFMSTGQTGIWDYWYEPQLPQTRSLVASDSWIHDFRAGNNGTLGSYDDIVELGSDQQPIPPPPPLTIAIADASKLEGNRGTTTLLMTVMLNRASNQAVTVGYRTNSGTADWRDFNGTSGTLTFQPGETSKTISVSIIGDRKREPNETFSVQLSNAVGANLSDSVGIGTILNDD